MLAGRIRIPCALHTCARLRPVPPFAPPRSKHGRHTCTTHAAQATDTKARQGATSVIKESREKIDTNPPRGTRDFFPEDMRLRNWLFGQFIDVSEAFGFERIDNPVLESEELFVRKAGEEITDQLYNFQDKGNRRIALRPELTPSLARMIIQKGKSLALPAKWYAVGQCWRYERMTRGRRREHYQWNMDIVGVEGQEAEAELLAAITMFFEKVGLTSKDVGIKVSSRKVLQEVLSRYGVPPESFGPVCVVVDKIEKLPEAEVVKQLQDLGVDPSAIEGVMATTKVQDMSDLKELLGEGSEAVKELEYFFELADGYGYKDWLILDASIVRGLAYYTGIVFEATDREGKLRAICGGGRYDRLLGTFGGENQPCSGFGFGDAVIVELLKDKKLLPDLARQVDDLVLVLDEPLRGKANGVAQFLRKSGRTVDLILEQKKMKWAFKYAEKIGAERLVILGNQEWEKGFVRIKDLAKREEMDVPIADLM
ncbi:hypothetical protein BSKO_06337 [Bryopsis sp. KO-2023]|nr:hypothetical protein BSKO_06337 [Bryopsis sp. KO-2023]